LKSGVSRKSIRSGFRTDMKRSSRINLGSTGIRFDFLALTRAILLSKLASLKDAQAQNYHLATD